MHCAKLIEIKEVPFRPLPPSCRQRMGRQQHVVADDTAVTLSE